MFGDVLGDTPRQAVGDVVARRDGAAQRTTRDVGRRSLADDPCARVRRPAARTRDHDDARQTPNFVRIAPAREQLGGVPPEDQKELVVRVAPPQLPKCVDGVRRPPAPHLDVPDLEALLALDRQPAHLDALPGVGDRGRPVRWHARGDEQHLVQAAALHRGPRRRQVTEVDGVERAPKDADPHG